MHLTLGIFYAVSQLAICPSHFVVLLLIIFKLCKFL
jgi:hypothetical protein